MRVDAFAAENSTGWSRRSTPASTAESRNVTVRAEFANPDHKLLPGMFANRTVATGASADVLTLPRTAIVYSLYGDNVFVVKPAPVSQRPAQASGGAAAAAPRREAHSWSSAGSSRSARRGASGLRSRKGCRRASRW